MNSLRNKLIASVVMLAVAAVMLTSASFAWYTVSTKGEVSQVKVKMEATKNLEIARAVNGPETVVTEPQAGDATTGDTTWGSTAWNWATESELDYVACTQSDGIYSMTWNETDYRLDSLQKATCGSYTQGVACYELEGPGVVAVAYGVMLRSNVPTTATAAISNTTNAKVALVLEDGAGNDSVVNSVELDGTTTPVFVKVVVFFDGTTTTAADVENGFPLENITVTFTSPDVP